MLVLLYRSDGFLSCPAGPDGVPYTNQVFLVLSHAQIERLKQNFAFELNGRVDEDHEAARFVCSWATKPEAVDALIAAL